MITVEKDPLIAFKWRKLKLYINADIMHNSRWDILTRMHSVGCVPSAIVAIRGKGCLPEGGCMPGECLPKGGWCLPGDVCQGVSARGCLPEGVSARGCLPRECLPGVVSDSECLPGGCLPSEQNDRCL